MNFKTKLLGIAVLPAVLIALAAFWLIQTQTQTLAESQIEDMERRTMETRRAELQKMSQLGVSAIGGLYNDTTLPQHIAQERALEVLNTMAFGRDGYFYVYDGKGKNLVHPRLPELVGKTWWDLQDAQGDYVIRNLIGVAKAGTGFHSYLWNKPSTGEPARKLGHAVYLDRWDWMIGTGLYVDDLETEIAAAREALSSAIDSTTRVLLIVTGVGVLLAALFTWAIRLNEQRFADQRLRALTHRIVEVQEDERKRVAGELHDGISQLLVSARYGLDRTASMTEQGGKAHSAVSKSMATIDSAIGEVRRISMALRPSVLDDIGLAAALKSLGEDFGAQAGIAVHVNAHCIDDHLPPKARTALYRVVQEALTNIARHSDAKQAWINLTLTGREAALKIEDDGNLNKELMQRLAQGVRATHKRRNEDEAKTVTDLMPSKETRLNPTVSPYSGMGLRNMRERMDAFDGSLNIANSHHGGLAISARLPIMPKPDIVQTESNDNPTSPIRDTQNAA